MAAICHLGYVCGTFGPPTLEYLGVSVTPQNFVMIDAVVFWKMNISIFGAFGWKMLIHFIQLTGTNSQTEIWHIYGQSSFPIGGEFTHGTSRTETPTHSASGSET